MGDTALTMGKYKALSEIKDIREMGEAVALALTQADKSVKTNYLSQQEILCLAGVQRQILSPCHQFQ